MSTGMNSGQRRVNKRQIDLLDRTILGLQGKLSTSENIQELRVRKVRLQTTIDEYSLALAAITEQHLNSVAERMRVADELAQVESRLVEVGDLMSNRTLSAFDKVLRNTLHAWKVPSVEYAEYDQYKMEIRAGSRLRSGRGKGVRSVLHSAFTTALAQYCQELSRPHPGFIVLDSPVVTYRDPHGDALGDDVDMTSNVVDYFYRDMLTFPGQSIIIENGDPPRDVTSQARTHRFALEEFDRVGFFPVVE